eukprot:TRINITY_DN1979_c0_g1_i1.p2 TRINITY_DN1979_c0_g1~~TRINITY_DN1979_c0_g1_i1.p2  ORF type:complete len:523 (+),score=131.34 TRINITY_DN1979_c0_g1_i1:118-1686(+)
MFRLLSANTRHLLRSSSLRSSEAFKLMSENNMNISMSDTHGLVNLSWVSQRFFGRPKQPKVFKEKERTKSLALSDEKSAKLSKAEEDAEAKKKKQEAEKAKLAKAKEKKIPIRTQLSYYEHRITHLEIMKMKNEELIREGKPPIVITKAMEEAQKERLERHAEKHRQQIVPLTPNTMPVRDTPALRRKIIHRYYNTEDEVNAKFKSQVKPVQGNYRSKRTGLLGIKVGMTGLFDKWGTRHHLTVLQVDRCQVIQLKNKEKDGYDALQLGVGEKNIKKLLKPEIGHYLKAGTPPKRRLIEFKITPENFLPVGYQLSVRHFTPGQLVDVRGITQGKGFQGPMKRWGFGGQPASHGVSISHRSHGATGQRQDPGKVFKGKKMAGRMGGRPRLTENLLVYKIDVERCLIYVKGSVPGRAGTVVEIRDAHKMREKNLEFLNFPTFVKEDGKQYAIEIVVPPPEQDPEEVYIHDNDVVADDAGAEQARPLRTQCTSLLHMFTILLTVYLSKSVVLFEHLLSFCFVDMQ